MAATASVPSADPAPASGERRAPELLEARPLVSIVVPVLNGERYLVESLDSILAQTYRPIEVLVMDDASTDATASIIASYGDRIIRHRQPRPQGIYANVNTGLELARGELIATYHADDVYDPEIVEREVEFLARYPQAAAVFCRDVFIDSAGRPFGTLELPAGRRYDAPLGYETVVNTLLEYKNAILRCPSAMVRASVYRELGGYNQDEFKNTSDLEMWLRIARRFPLGVLDEPLFRYRRGHGSSSERYHKLRLEPERFFTIMDLELQRVGRDRVPPPVLASYEAHRADDLLKVAAANYVAGHRDEMRRALAEVRARRILAGRHVRRRRLLVLWALLRVLAPLPNLPPVGVWLRGRLGGS
jgi:glycosyltransferase involved in cell wall biosynthesis